MAQEQGGDGRELASDEADEQTKPFRLLDLPPELWSRICKLAVTNDKPIVLNFAKSESRSEGEQNASFQPAVTRVCRHIRTECLSTFYTQNIFYGWCHGESHLAPRQWLYAIGPRNRAFLQRFYIRYVHRGPFAVHEFLLLKEELKLNVNEEPLDEGDEIVEALKAVGVAINCWGVAKRESWIVGVTAQ